MSPLVLRRLAWRAGGIFSMLLLDGAPRFAAVEGPIPAPAGSGWHPVIPPGEYHCVRGMHRLTDLNAFATYEVTGVLGHSGLLFHSGNFGRESHGCILLGKEFGFLDGELAVLNSRLAFHQFMFWAAGRPALSLTVLT